MKPRHLEPVGWLIYFYEPLEITCNGIRYAYPRSNEIMQQEIKISGI